MMKRLFIQSLLIFWISGMTSAQSPWRAGEMQVLVPIGQPGIEIFANLVSGLGIDTEPAGDFIRCYLTQGEAKAFTDAGIAYQTEIADLNAWSASFGLPGVPSGYYTVAELDEIADSLALNFPDICTLYTLGTGTGFNQLIAIKISDNSALDENEAEVMFDGGIHGDEVGGPENMIRFARDLCLGYGQDPVITALVDTREIWIYYCVNPYGRNNMTRYNGNGVDINRDCGYMWNNEGNSPSAFSQPETKAYRKLLTENQFAIHCSYHSGTEYISYPWSYRANHSADHAIHDYLASIYAENSGYSGIPYGQGYTGMYAINGSTKDFGYGALGSISWSVEISVDKQPPASQIGSFYMKNKPSMLKMVENAGYGINGTITDSITGLPLPANIFIDNLFPVTSDPVNGDYHKFLLPGNYNIKVVSSGYETRTITGISISTMSVSEINIALLPVENNRFARRIISCQIPNNNFNDEGNTPAALGPPDNLRYSIGRNGYAIIDLGDTLTDGTGPEVIVYENDVTPESYQLFAGQTMDGPWILMGNGTGNFEFDLEVTALPSARFLKIKDDGDGQSQVADAGFDLDAIEGILHLPAVDSTGFITGIVSSVELQLPVQGATVTCGNKMTITDEQGYYLIEADTGIVEICGEFQQMYMYDCDSVVVAPGDTLIHDMYLPVIESTGETNPYKVNISIFPNPANGFTCVTIEGKFEIIYCELVAPDGHHMTCDLTYSGKQALNIHTSHLVPGIYFIRIFTDSHPETLKLLIQR
ncbi:MAG: M14 family zinc carboxypeptidase [Bacteroidota bacterium]